MTLPRPPRRFLSWRDLLLFVTAIVLLAMWTVNLFYQAARPFTAAAPFAYTDAAGTAQTDAVMRYQAANPTLCAGDALRYTIYVTITDVPTALETDYAIRSVRTGRAVWYGLFAQDASRPRVPYAVPTRFAANLQTVIPAATPPGPYRLEVVAHDGIHAPNGFVVPFAVTPCGPRGV